MPERSVRPVIGLTGPMCAGKNRVGEILERRGFAVVDADTVAHQALVDVADEVLSAFGDIAAKMGTELKNADGSINRRALGSVIFSDPALLARHESIIYPRINELLGSFIDEHQDRPVVINAPLLHKSPILGRCDFVIFVDAWPVIRLFRAIMRDRMPIWQIFARFSAQKNLFAQYLSRNVDTLRVQNKGSIRALEKRLVKLLSIRGY
jgi:dephospho-CoA kinase